jgi:hypothetical protein
MSYLKNHATHTLYTISNHTKIKPGTSSLTLFFSKIIPAQATSPPSKFYGQLLYFIHIHQIITYYIVVFNCKKNGLPYASVTVLRVGTVTSKERFYSVIHLEL